MEIIKTNCCALSQLCKIDNRTRLGTIKQIIEEKRKEALNEDADAFNYGKSETTLFAVTTPLETSLAKRLQKVGFIKVQTFKRRLCTLKYERQLSIDGDITGEELTMWIINLI
jgi:hypothetical protein